MSAKSGFGDNDCSKEWKKHKKRDIIPGNLRMDTKNFSLPYPVEKDEHCDEFCAAMVIGMRLMNRRTIKMLTAFFTPMLFPSRNIYFIAATSL